ncbi:hypothetical protein LSH36_117g04022 [Paralvinella palmiformis]|uniref:Uncharacterized protein n=1 Tax=Paralvinella palmiformis TaxID=53620 RepID=A0AAD9JZ56_9ANNE|nr:hypothetical protein LSH36_117g04022 [Paralvinella palmiformis]
MRNMKKKMEEDAQQRESGYYITMTDDELAHIQTSSPDNLTIAPFQRVKPQNDFHQSDLRRQFHDILQCGSAPADSHNIRVGYIHASTESGGQNGMENTSLAIISTNPITRPLTESSDSSDVDDLDDTSHMPLTALRTPYQNLGITGPAQAGMIYSHHRKLGRLPALTHKMPTENNCSIPRRHSISTNMVVTSSLSAGNEKSDGNPFTSKQSTTRVEGTMSEGNTTHTLRHGHSRKPQNNHEKPAADGLLCPQGTALGLMSREYTELLLHRLRSQKNQKSSNLGTMTTISTPAATTGSRHSTCE